MMRRDGFIPRRNAMPMALPALGWLALAGEYWPAVIMETLYPCITLDPGALCSRTRARPPFANDVRRAIACVPGTDGQICEMNIGDMVALARGQKGAQ
jgi:hypothetical protein